jgi:hypothetical protein
MLASMQSTNLYDIYILARTLEPSVIVCKYVLAYDKELEARYVWDWNDILALFIPFILSKLFICDTNECIFHTQK